MAVYDPMKALVFTGGTIATDGASSADLASVRDNLQAQIDAFESGSRIVGDWDPATGAFPTDPSPISSGDQWNSVGTGTVDGVSFAPGDIITALVDTPSSTVYADNWSKREGTATAADQVSTNDTGQSVQDRLDKLGAVYDSHADFLATNIPPSFDIVGFKQKAFFGTSVVVLSVVRDPAGPIGPSADGGMWSPADGYLSPGHWGAAGDGDTDDVDAVNNMFSFIRDNPGGEYDLRPYVIDGGPFWYRCDSRVDAGLLWPIRGTEIRQLKIRSYAYDQVAFDLSGSRYVRSPGLVVIGEGQNNELERPWCGVLLSRTDPLVSNRPCNHIYLDGLISDGWFRGASVINLAAEEVTMVYPQIWNRAISNGLPPGDPDYAPAYSLVMDGRSAFPGKSPHGQESSRSSFTMNTLYSPNIRKPYGTAGPTVYLADCASVRFYKPYIVNGSGSAVEWHLYDDFNPYDVEFDGLQVETSGNQRIFEFVPESGDLEYKVLSLSVSTGNIYSSDEAFLFNGSGSVHLYNLNLNVPRWNGGVSPTNGMFNPSPSFKLTGINASIPNASDIGNTNLFSGFSGFMYSYSTGVKDYRGNLSVFGSIRSRAGTYLDGNGDQVVGNQQPQQPAVIVNATTGTLPSPNNIVNIADADNPTNDELLEFCVELQNRQANLISMMKTHGLIASV